MSPFQPITFFTKVCPHPLDEERDAAKMIAIVPSANMDFGKSRNARRPDDILNAIHPTLTTLKMSVLAAVK